MADSTLADGQCAKKDGRGWHCKSQRLGGRSYCEKHYLQRVKSKSKSKSKSRVSVTDRRAEVQVSSTAVEDQCAKRNGKGWRCKSRRFGGTRYCEKHHLRELSRVRVSDASARKKTKKKQSTGLIVDDGQCTRSDGRGWRCGSPRFGGRRYCEKHHLQTLSGAGSKFKGRVSHTKVEEEKKLEGDAFGASSSSEINGKKEEKLGRPPKVKNVEGKSRKRTKRSDQSAEQKRSVRPWKEKKLEGAVEMKRPRKKSRARETEMGGGEEEADRVMELGQVWAFPNGTDGSPRSYARIDRIIPLPVPSVVRVAPLVPHPVTDDEKLFAEQGLSLACGLFKASESIVTKEISAFTHKVQFEIEEKQGSFFKIFPKEGEIWAIYWRWDALKKTFDYQLVEVESDFDEEDGVKVFALVKVEGRDGVYRRHQYAGFHLVRSFLRAFMIMFSHKVPSSKIVEGGEMLWKVMLHWMG